MNIKKEFEIELNGKKYPVIITKNKMFQKNIYFRFKDGKYYISASKMVSDAKLLKELEKFAPKLLKKEKKSTYFLDSGVYIFGELVEFNEGFIMINGHYYLYKDENNFYKNMKKNIMIIFYLELDIMRI